MLVSRTWLTYSPLVLIILAAIGIHSPASQARPDEDTLWVEGESASFKQVTPNAWYSDAVRKDQMSGGGWLSHFSAAADGEARYELSVAKDGDYVLWVRGNPVGTLLSYRVNDGSWSKMDASKASDVVNVAEDDKPDLRFLGWMRGGIVPLKKGPATVAFKMHSAVNHHGSIDCFVLTTKPYEPRGILRPGEVEPPPTVPTLSDDNIRKWIAFIRPSADDSRWERLEWRTELGAAVEEARALQRPILLWTMNGHPLGCT